MRAWFLALLLMVVSVSALAQTAPENGCKDSPTSSIACTKSRAYSMAQAMAQYNTDDANSHGYSGIVPCVVDVPNEHLYKAWAGYSGCPVTPIVGSVFVFYYSLAPPVCGGSQPIPGAQAWIGGNGEACLNGCGYEPVQQASGTTVDGKSMWVTDSAGLAPTGQACGAPPDISDPKTPGDCEPVPGQTMCVKKDGSLCATAARTGKKLCWKAGETGQKTTGDMLGIKQAGSQHTAPNLQLPSGDTLIQDQAPKAVTNTTVKDGSTSTINSNVATYTTQNGTDAGSADQADGEEGDEKGNSASGGGDCESPPIVTGDEALGMVANQAWATRCAVEAGNATKVTGDVGDCASSFSVEGTTAEAHQLRAMRAEWCGDGPGWAKPKNGEGSNADPHAGADGKDGPGLWGLNIGGDLLDASGFSGGSCPQLGMLDLGPLGQISLDAATWWCPLIAALGAVMLLMGTFISFRILMGD